MNHQNGEKMINFFLCSYLYQVCELSVGLALRVFHNEECIPRKKNDALLKYSENIKTLTERKIDTGSLRKGTVSW